MSDALTPAHSESLHHEPSESLACEARVELLLERHRVTGIIQHLGVGRRLVDALNATDGPIVMLRDAWVQSLIDHGEDPQRFDLLQLKREAILLAMPATDAPLSPHRPEILEKRPVVATLLLPGFDVTGHIYLPPEIDPSAARLLHSSDFLPVTDAEVVYAAFDGCRRQEPLVVVNLERALLYAVVAGKS